MIGGNQHWFVEELGHRVAQERADRAEAVLNGMCQDFADYRYSAGFFEGLKKAIEIADEIQKQQDSQ